MRPVPCRRPIGYNAAVKVLAVLDGAEPVGIAVGEKAQQGGMPVVHEVFE